MPNFGFSVQFHFSSELVVLDVASSLLADPDCVLSSSGESISVVVIGIFVTVLLNQ